MRKMISTWKMSYDGMRKASKILKNQSLGDAIVCAIQDVEQNPDYISVGHGGLPNREGRVQLDGAYMDGNTLGFGGVIEVENISSPIAVSKKLSEYTCNCLLTQSGAEAFAKEHGFSFENHLTKKSYERYIQKRNEVNELKAYEGHDTVCVIGKKDDQMACGVSTSGLFMKHPGRVGDSPIIGSGFYVDALIGGVCATGLGEDIMRGALSIRAIDLMQNGISVQDALNQVLDAHMERMKKADRTCDAISLIGMDHHGNVAATTNIEQFPYVVVDEDDTILMVATYKNGKHGHFIADEVWLKNYTGD